VGAEAAQGARLGRHLELPRVHADGQHRVPTVRVASLSLPGRPHRLCTLPPHAPFISHTPKLSRRTDSPNDLSAHLYRRLCSSAGLIQDEQVANRLRFRDFGWEIAHAAVSDARRFPTTRV
jgi:hypothetical protein